MSAFKVPVLCIAAQLFCELTKEQKCYIAHCSAPERHAKSWRRMLVSLFCLSTVYARRHSLYNSPLLYFPDMSPSGNEPPKLGPNRSACHRSHQALLEQTSHVGLGDFTSSQGTGIANRFSAGYKSAIWGKSGNLSFCHLRAEHQQKQLPPPICNFTASCKTFTWICIFTA